MAGRLVILAGPSSVGTSSVVDTFRHREAAEGRHWHPVEIDDVLARLPARWVDVGWPGGPGELADQGLSIVDRDGRRELCVGPLLRALLRGYQAGAVAMADEGVDVIVDDVLLDQEHLDGWRRALLGRDAVWVEVRCDPDEIDRREESRGDRPLGLARAQRSTVVDGVRFDLVLDTTTTAPVANAEVLSRWLAPGTA